MSDLDHTSRLISLRTLWQRDVVSAPCTIPGSKGYHLCPQHGRWRKKTVHPQHNSPPLAVRCRLFQCLLQSRNMHHQRFKQDKRRPLLLTLAKPSCPLPSGQCLPTVRWSCLPNLLRHLGHRHSHQEHSMATGSPNRPSRFLDHHRSRILRLLTSPDMPLKCQPQLPLPRLPRAQEGSRST